MDVYVVLGWTVAVWVLAMIASARFGRRLIFSL